LVVAAGVFGCVIGLATSCCVARNDPLAWLFLVPAEPLIRLATTVYPYSTLASVLAVGLTYVILWVAVWNLITALRRARRS